MISNNLCWVIGQQEDAFDDAVKGVDAIMHTASPFPASADDPNAIIVPAVRGTTNVLASAQKFAPTVKRIVMTSSAAAIVSNSPPPGGRWSETDWNTSSPQEVEEKGKGATVSDMYRASKTLAEKAAWDFVNAAGMPWDFVALCPTLVYGPVIHEVEQPDKLNASMHDLWMVVSGQRDNTYLANTR